MCTQHYSFLPKSRLNLIGAAPAIFFVWKPLKPGSGAVAGAAGAGAGAAAAAALICFWLLVETVKLCRPGVYSAFQKRM